jgi:hypothetical protein
MKHLLFLIITLFIITGCSQRQYFEPEDSKSFNQDSKNMSAEIEAFNADGATLDNGQVISKRGITKTVLPEGYEFLNVSEGKLIATNNKDKVFIDGEIIDLKNVVIAATLKDDLLAMLFSDNAIVLYDLKDKKVVLKEYMEKSFANDVRIANPHFMSNIILFPTLNGKVVVVSKQNYKIVRNITVDADGRFNNIIFLQVVNDTLVAATANKIISVGDGVLNVKSYEIRDVISHGTDIYIATIDGQIIKTDISLNVQDRKKYQFAKVYALAFGESLYALESQGYLINISEDFQTDNIYDFSFDEDEKVISIDDTIYFGSEYIKLK